MTIELPKIIAVFNFLGTIQAVLIALTLATGKQKQRMANRYLAALLLVIATIISVVTLSHMDGIFILNFLEKIEYTFSFLAGPLLLFYYLSVSRPDWKLSGLNYLHFVPAALCAVYGLLAAYQPPVYWYINIRVILLHQMIYTAVTGYLYLTNSKAESREWTGNENRLKWARNILAFMALVHLVQFVRLFQLHPSGFEDVVPFFCALIFVSIGFVGLKESMLFRDLPPADKYANSTLSAEMARRYKDKLLHYMENQRPYLRKSLTLKMLAKELGIPTNHLSQLLNEQLQQNFFDFVNQYRINAAREKISNRDYAHYTIESIALDVGFRSRSTFYDVFRKQVGMTPSEYRRQFLPTGD